MSQVLQYEHTVMIHTMDTLSSIESKRDAREKGRENESVRVSGNVCADMGMCVCI